MVSRIVIVTDCVGAITARIAAALRAMDVAVSEAFRELGGFADSRAVINELSCISAVIPSLMPDELPREAPQLTGSSRNRHRIAERLRANYRIRLYGR
jgi:hypothetical protein